MGPVKDIKVLLIVMITKAIGMLKYDNITEPRDYHNKWLLGDQGLFYHIFAGNWMPLMLDYSGELYENVLWWEPERRSPFLSTSELKFDEISGVWKNSLNVAPYFIHGLANITTIPPIVAARPTWTCFGVIICRHARFLSVFS
jgi:hypothetical protein